MTEDEARKKWCPMGRERFTEHICSGSGNINPEAVNHKPDKTLCIASECMLWRWDGVRIEGAEDAWDGHCGLAGKP